MGFFDSRFWQVAAASTGVVAALAVGVFDGGATAALTIPSILGSLTVVEVGGAVGAGVAAAGMVRQIQTSKRQE